MWAQGEHIAVIGQTGSGKSYLVERILRYHEHCIFLRTKADPDIKLVGYVRTRKAADISAIRARRWLLNPKYDEQKAEALSMLERVYRAGGWTVCLDELYYAVDRLKAESEIVRLLTQARSLKVSVVSCMQRPSRVPRWAVSEPRYVFAFSCEGRDVKTIGESTTRRIEPLFDRLERYQFAFFDRVTKQVAIGNARSLGSLFNARPYSH